MASLQFVVESKTVNATLECAFTDKDIERLHAYWADLFGKTQDENGEPVERSAEEVATAAFEAMCKREFQFAAKNEARRIVRELDPLPAPPSE